MKSKQRSIEQQPWQRYQYVCDVSDMTISVTRLTADDDGNYQMVLDRNEIVAACNTTVLLDRLIAKRTSKKRK